MEKDLNVMAQIQSEKAKEHTKEELHPLDAEGIALTEHKRETLDVVATPVDPLR